MKQYIDLLYEAPLCQTINKADMESMLTCLNPYGRFYKKGNYITMPVMTSIPSAWF
jgi:hypothetical protein